MSILLPVNVCIIAGGVANIVDSDQTPQNAASDLDLHCLLRRVCPNPWSKYGNSIEIILDLSLRTYEIQSNNSKYEAD